MPILSCDQVWFGGGAQSGLAFTSFPEPTNQFFGLGFGGGVHGDVNIMPALSARLNIDYHRFPSDKTKLKETWIVIDQNGNRTNDFSVEGANIGIVGATADLIGRIPTGSAVRPYGLVGAGLQFISMSEQRVLFNGETLAVQRAPDGTTNFGVNVGAGAELALGQRTGLFVQATYTLIFASGGTSSYIPLTFGVSF